MVANGFDDDQTRSFANLGAGTKVSYYTIIFKIGAGGSVKHILLFGNTFLRFDPLPLNESILLEKSLIRIGPKFSGQVRPCDRFVTSHPVISGKSGKLNQT